MSGSTTPSTPPLLRVVKGDPTAEELAALVAVVAARSAVGVAPPEPVPRPSGWAARRPALRRPVHVGAGEWAASGFEPGTRTRAHW